MPTNAMKFRKFAARGSFIGGSDARIIMGTTRQPSSASGARSAARSNQRTSPATSSSS